ncbi:MAG: hypothetical protein LBF97_04420 [Elusimicrobiota bacterium]|nr:hypothetical protein [Elusimicrobiota bacterium]
MILGGTIITSDENLEKLKEKENRKKSKPQQEKNDNIILKKKGRPKKINNRSSLLDSAGFDEDENIILPIQDEIQACIDESILIKEIEEEDENVENENTENKKKFEKRARNHSKRWMEWKEFVEGNDKLKIENIKDNEILIKNKRKRETFYDQPYVEDEEMKKKIHSEDLNLETNMLK